MNRNTRAWAWWAWQWTTIDVLSGRKWERCNMKDEEFMSMWAPIRKAYTNSNTSKMNAP